MEGSYTIALLLLGSLLFGVNGDAEIDPSLRTRRFLQGGDKQNVMVSFTQGISSVIERINGQNFSSPSEKREALTNAQQTFSNGVQGGLQRTLGSMGVPFETFWINNRMIVPNVDSRIVSVISRVPGVAKVEKEPEIKINPVDKGTPWEEDFEENSNRTRYGRQQGRLAWGVQKIRANQVWNSYGGRGIVVANIDTGVRVSHQSLRNNWRSSYGWYDPYSRTSSPNDQNGHGTHTMGTIAGAGGIGVAPEATWIACKGCNSDSCGASQLYSCGQWIQCPTTPSGGSKKCEMAPHIVSNSWGGSGGQTWYDDIISSWQSVGIIPVVSIGNSGPNCNTAGSPGDRPRVIGVGSTDSNDRISSFSSLGASSDGNVKPDISAPGGAIPSAWHTSDTAYNTISGTSMACPHVSGVIALMKQKNLGLNYNGAYKAIAETAIRSTLDTSTARTCNGRGPSSWPNNVFGYGRIDAVNSVNAV